MRPKLQLLGPELIERIVAEAFELIMRPGVRVGSLPVIEVLQSAGVEVSDGIAHIPESLARKCLASVPREFYLYDRQGNATVHYGGDDVHFAPGSCCVQVLDPETLQARPSLTQDLVRLVGVTETLPQFAAQSTAMTCNDAPSEIGDLYRLFVVLQNSNKPVVTGSFSAAGLPGMIDLLIADSGSAEQLRNNPRAVFDVCPSPPLNWSEFGAHNLLDLARAGVPAEIVSMPLAGAAAPVTLAGSITQHAAECLAGITIHQLASPGAPIVWGGAPAIFDMRTGTTPMGAIETAMLNMGCAEVGKHFGLPTHGYLVATDSKFVDAQAGMESARSAVLGALSGINMISGAGMIDFLACHSVEKLVIDAEAIASAQRLLQGIEPRGETLATGAFAEIGLSGEFLKLKETRALFRQEQQIPSDVIDRNSRGVEETQDNFARAGKRVEELTGKYRRPELPDKLLREWKSILERETGRAKTRDAAASL
jgi:trimethylamine--corrinoid protein Co-methyltransferase